MVRKTLIRNILSPIIEYCRIVPYSSSADTIIATGPRGPWRFDSARTRSTITCVSAEVGADVIARASDNTPYPHAPSAAWK